jgi:hypothetical protein
VTLATPWRIPRRCLAVADTHSMAIEAWATPQAGQE